MALTRPRLLAPLWACALVLAACSGGPQLVPGICRDGPTDGAGNPQQVCTPRGQGDPVNVVLAPEGSWPEFDSRISSQAELFTTLGALNLSPPRFDPRRDQVLWPARGRSPVIVTFAVADPARGGGVSTLRVMFRPEDGTILGYRRVPRT